MTPPFSVLLSLYKTLPPLSSSVNHPTLSLSSLLRLAKRKSTNIHINKSQLAIILYIPKSNWNLEINQLSLLLCFNFVLLVSMDVKERRSSSPTLHADAVDDELDLRRGPWTVDEDLTLMNYITTHGEGRWNSLARSAGKNNFLLLLHLNQLLSFSMSFQQ